MVSVCVQEIKKTITGSDSLPEPVIESLTLETDIES
jgi:hypothetical protein